jgi:SAM-dependent methyltransferase
MNTAGEIAVARDKLIELHGPWSAHKIDLGEGVYTTDNLLPIGFPDVVSLIEDFLWKPFEQLRILDLGCLEGGHAIEFARRGCEVLGIEMRNKNLAKCLFARDILGLSRASFVQDDVRNLSVDKYGTFDIVICSSIMEHLDAPDSFKFINDVGRVCSGLLYLNTHYVGEEALPAGLTVGPSETVLFNGREYTGRPIREHNPWDSSEERESRVGSSFHNDFSFWPTYESLWQLLVESGFHRVYHCLTHWHVANRGAFIGVKKWHSLAPTQRPV